MFVGQVSTLQFTPVDENNNATTATAITAVSSNTAVVTVTTNSLAGQFTVTAVAIGTADIVISGTNGSNTVVSTVFPIVVAAVSPFAIGRVVPGVAVNFATGILP